MQNEFDTLYSKTYRKAFEYHRKHYKAKAEHQWDDLAKDSRQFEMQFEKDIALAIIAEIERCNK